MTVLLFLIIACLSLFSKIFHSFGQVLEKVVFYWIVKWDFFFYRDFGWLPCWNWRYCVCATLHRIVPRLVILFFSVLLLFLFVIYENDLILTVFLRFIYDQRSCLQADYKDFYSRCQVWRWECFFPDLEKYR